MKTNASFKRMIDLGFVTMTAFSTLLIAQSAMSAELVCRMKFNHSTGGPALIVSTEKMEVEGRIGSQYFVSPTFETNDDSRLTISGQVLSRTPCQGCIPGRFSVELQKNPEGRFEGTSIAYTMRMNRRGISEITSIIHMNLLCD